MEPASAVDLAEAYRQCRTIARAEAKNFYYAFITLPSRRRQAIYATYAFARLCDDIVDSEGATTEERVAALDRVRHDLQAAYDGEPRGAVLTALLDAARTFDIPQQYFLDLVDGVAMDLTTRRYQTFDDLLRYCYGVASTVGLITIRIFGCASPQASQHAVDLGYAMQLTNVLRDLAEDAQRDRIYLPQEELERFGYAEGDLLQGVVNDSFRRLMAFQVARARDYFARGRRLLPHLSPRSRACVAVLHGLYMRILDRIEARDYDVFQGRVSLSTPTKLVVTVRLWGLSLVAGTVSWGRARLNGYRG